MITDLKTPKEILGEKYYNTLNEDMKNILENNSIDEFSISFKMGNGKELKFTRVSQKILLNEVE